MARNVHPPGGDVANRVGLTDTDDRDIPQETFVVGVYGLDGADVMVRADYEVGVLGTHHESRSDVSIVIEPADACRWVKLVEVIAQERLDRLLVNPAYSQQNG